MLGNGSGHFSTSPAEDHHKSRGATSSPVVAGDWVPAPRLPCLALCHVKVVLNLRSLF